MPSFCVKCGKQLIPLFTTLFCPRGCDRDNLITTYVALGEKTPYLPFDSEDEYLIVNDVKKMSAELQPPIYLYRARIIHLKDWQERDKYVEDVETAMQWRRGVKNMPAWGFVFGRLKLVELVDTIL